MERLYKCQERLEQRVEERMWCHPLNEEDPLLQVLLKDRLYDVIGFQPNRSPLAQLYQTCLDAKEPGEEITAADIDAFEEALDCDFWELTPQQKRKIPRDPEEITDWRMGELTRAAWEEGRRLDDICGAAEKVVKWNDRLPRGYIQPEELIERLRKLKPSDNFEPRGNKSYYHWPSLPKLHEEGEDQRAPYPWHLVEDRWGLYHELPVWRKMKLRDRWEPAICDVQSPVPDLHPLKNMGRSPGGTLFPWYLVEGLMALRGDANEKGNNWYIEEYDIAVGKRKEAIYRWKKEHPDSVLLQDQFFDCGTWPADLVDELDEIDRESVRRGRRKYIVHLRQAEKKMQTLVAFWRDCGAVTGQRVQPRSWWDDSPILRMKRLTRPQYLRERLDAIGKEFGCGSDKGRKLQMSETVFWMDSIINNDSEPAESNLRFPQSLLNELDTIWQHRNRHRGTDDTEDEMLAAIRRWRESQDQPRSKEGGPPPPYLGTDTV
ncbi:MAG: hypothetical protein Q9164_007233 [Protoblastenia rupestris]